jgi:putative radical SAM enzyme (TIGR03279 family)
MLENKMIAAVRPGSLAACAQILPGDVLLAVNGEEFSDLIDLGYLLAEEEIELRILARDGQERFVAISKAVDENIGLEFHSAVFDGIKTCANNCVFCFVAQMPPGLRGGLYIRDDDYRLSFLSGNFVTLTNLTEEDKKRIISLKLSPLYLSVHATDAVVRRKLLGNQAACDLLVLVEELAAAGIKFHAQVVLCPGLNDREIFDKTYHDLLDLNESVLSVAAVPAGLTRFCPPAAKGLRAFTSAEAREVIEQAASWQKECRQSIGRHFVHPSDEFYVLAGLPFPAAECYDGFAQYENGVGICRKFLDDWQKARIATEGSPKEACVVCGRSAEAVLSGAMAEIEAALGVRHRLLVLENDFFGGTVTVTGLLTGRDILNGINKLPARPRRIVLPGIALKSQAEPLFLDGMAVGDLARSLAGAKLKIAWSASELKSILCE